MALNSDLQTLNKVTELEKKTVTDNYNAAIDKARKQYAEQENLIDAQKYINERQIAEQMDNLGLTDSGLNRTQQTAVQLSATNSRNKIARQRQEAVDALILEMNSKLTDLETQRLQNEQSIRNSYEQAAASARSYSGGSSGRDSSSDDLSGAAQKKNWLKLIDTVKDDNGTVYYTFADSNGKTIKRRSGINPYTNDNNANNKDLNKYGFWNGYQPKGFTYVDAKGKTQDTGKLTEVYGQKSYITGKEQRVWQDAQGNKWVWDDYQNAYIGVS